MKTLSEAIRNFLETIKLARSHNTFLSYRNAMHNFTLCLKDHDVDVEKAEVQSISEDVIVWFADDLKQYSPATEQLYITAVKSFFDYLVAEELTNINLTKIKLLIRQRTRRMGKRLPQFPADSISQIIHYYENQGMPNIKDEKILLRALRDRAFLITLADTGLRVHEACALRRGDIDWNEGKALIIGKGDQQAIVRFSQRSQNAIKQYLQKRSGLDGKSGKTLASLPLFARHDKGAGEKIKPITTSTGRNIVAERVLEVFGEGAVGTITPHSFRHYFVTRVLTTTGNLKLAQNLARHKNIAVTQRYAHLSNDELDKGYWQVFED
jgi:site-specific recombinase XerD